jgi:HAD superfamily hydrolase (TIGR01509 family)
MEDVERPKPDPIGVLMACAVLGEDPMNCVIIGDTPDDIKAGKAGGLHAWGVLTPDEVCVCVCVCVFVCVCV